MSKYSKSSAAITVCICTYNRAESLQNTLRSLAAQAGIENLAWELLIVDNNSKDSTPAVAEQFESVLPLRYVKEPKQGLSEARNRALAEYRGGLLLFTDDDVVLDEHWLESYAAAESNYPMADYFGGRILPQWEDGSPSWLKDPSLDLISGLLVYFDLGRETRLLNASDPLPFGASFAIRRNLVESAGSFRVDLGVKGGSPGRGEESEYLARAREAGAKGAYVGNAVCYHVQDKSRFRLGHLYRYGIETGRAEYLLDRLNKGSQLAEAKFLMKGFWQLLKGRGDRFRQCVINAGIQRGLRVSKSG